METELIFNPRFRISFYGKAYSEQTLIQVAYAFEQLTQVRNKAQPIRIPRTELCDVLWYLDLGD